MKDFGTTDASPDFKALKVDNDEEVAIPARIKNIHVLLLANTNIISRTCVYNHCNTGYEKEKHGYDKCICLFTGIFKFLPDKNTP